MACDLSKLEQINGVVDRYKYFDKFQDGSWIIWKGNLVWESGSHRELSEGNVGVLADSTWIDPSDLNEVRLVLNYQRVYAQQRLEDAVKHFEASKDALNTQAIAASNYGSRPPEKEQLKEVKKLQATVRNWERKLDNILKTLNPEPEKIEYSEEELEQQNVNRSDAENFIAALGEIQI